MASGITLSAGVRQNLLSLQNTASMMASTQNRLATGKKVNSALDNPSNFFTSQTLADRAGDLNGLLDSIGQATKTLDAANNGITSLTKLVQSAKSIAQQARSATGATETYSSVGASASILDAANLNGGETVATTSSLNKDQVGPPAIHNLLEAQNIAITGDVVTETAGVLTGNSATNLEASAVAITGTPDLRTLQSFGSMTTGIDISGGVGAGLNGNTITVNVSTRGGANVAFTTAAITTGDDNTDIAALLSGAVDSGGNTLGTTFTVAAASGGRISITSTDYEADLSIASTATTDAIGLTTAATTTNVRSTSLLDALTAEKGSTAVGDTLTIASTNAAGTSNGTQTITFGTGAGQVNTVADLNTRLAAAAGASAGGFTASVNGSGQIAIGQAAAGEKSSVTVAGTLGGVGANSTKSLIEGATAGRVFGTTNSQKTASDLAKLTTPAGDLSSGGTLDISINGATAVQVAIGANDRIDDVINSINTDLGASLTATKVTVSGHDQIRLTGIDSSVDVTIEANDASAAFGLTTNSSTDRTQNGNSLFRQLQTAGAANGNTLEISGTDSAGDTFSESIAFGTGVGQVKTLDDLNTQLAAAANAAGNVFSASVVGGALSITQSASDKGSVKVGGTVASIATAAGVLEGTAGSVFSNHNSQATLADLASKNGETLTNGGQLSFTVNNKNFTVGLSASDRVDDVLAKLNSSAAATNLTFSKETDVSGHDHIKIDAKDSSVDFRINANDTSKVLGLTTNAGGTDISDSVSKTANSTSLLDRLHTAFGGATNGQGKTLTVAANGGKTQTITFGTGTNQVQTLDQLNTKLSELTGVTASVSDTGALEIQVESGTKATSLEVGGTAAAKLGLTAGKTEGEVISTTASQTRANLQNDYNNVLSQIDTLTKDASYNGINLLNGDDLKVTFNENGSSSLTIKGVTFDSNNLGMMSVKGDTFQDNSLIDERISAIDTALSDLRSQGSKFGSNLSTVQTRQEFTKNMINTLQTGSDALVLADTNEEGANLLALQTRQQLSTTALSMSSQQDQAVLRLF